MILGLRALAALVQVAVVLAFATCGGAPPAAKTSTGTLLPLGDGKISSAPRTGYVWSCQTTFNGQGAQGSAPWVSGSGWNPALKPRVQGDVSWSRAHYSVSIAGDQRLLKTVDLPVGDGTGVFPISPDDPAYAYDRNPNRIEAQETTLNLPATPAPTQSSCLGLGPVGILTDGVFLFDALDALGRDAVPHEVLDRCDGHPAPGGVYHHHDVPSCLLAKATGRSTLVGYAFDGFGIYVERDAAGRLLTNSDLDACHGRTSPVEWDGKTVTVYHYDATAEYPYVIGCYRGAPVSTGALAPDSGARPGG
ncbi:MAG TPA: YHYH protein [Candidatus Dormibacteraeota bacterium]